MDMTVALGEVAEDDIALLLRLLLLIVDLSVTFCQLLKVVIWRLRDNFRHRIVKSITASPDPVVT